jgi:Flp pilus assembly protein TadD
MADRDVCERADQLLAIGRAAAAIELLAKHIATHPEDASALRLLAAAHTDLDRYADALRWADRAVAVEPLVAGAWHSRATALLGLEQVDEAIVAATRAVELEPDNWVEQYLLGRALVHGPNRSRDAIRVARITVDLAPTEADAHVLLGMAYSRLGDTEAESAAYRAALGLDPQNTSARNNLAVIDLREGRHEKAMRGFRDAVANDPQNTTMHQNIGKSAFSPMVKQGKWVVAIVVAVAALAVNNPVPYWVRAVLAGAVVLGWGVFGWVRIGRLSPAVRRLLVEQTRFWWGKPPIRGFLVGLVANQVCAVAALLVPATGLVPDLLLGAGAVAVFGLGVVGQFREDRSAQGEP